jgi:hypothetical protein
VVTTPTPTAPAGAASALPRLQAYLSQVDAKDAQLKAAAALVNADVTATDIRLRPATQQAARAAQDLAALRRAIPAGMSLALTRSALLVFSNLASRAAAFHGVLTVALPVSAVDYRTAMNCLANGGRAAARFPADVAALRALATQSPAFRAVPESSRAAAEIALQTEFVWAREACCDSCGGYVGADLAPIVWGRSTGISGPSDGMINGVDFDARYRDATGWTVRIHAG